jgi:hypothetical protein
MMKDYDLQSFAAYCGLYTLYMEQLLAPPAQRFLYYFAHGKNTH